MDSKSINLSAIKTYLETQGIDVSKSRIDNFINSCFTEADTMDTKGEKVDGGDGFLSEIELGVFLKKVFSKMFGFNIADDSKCSFDSDKRKLVEKEFYPNGNLKSENYSDGTSTTYYPDGKIYTRSSYSSGTVVKERYKKDGSLNVRELYSFGYGKNFMEPGLKERVVYKNNMPLLGVQYDANGKIINYAKMLPEGEIDFDENLLNGEFDADFNQGKTGVCYLASAVKALLQNENGKVLLKNALKYDKEKEVGTVTFAGLDRKYSFSKQDIQKAMTRLGTGDPDFTLLCLGYEKYREEQGRTADGGHANDLLVAFGVKNASLNYNMELGELYPIDDDMVTNMKTVMQSGNGFSCAGSFPELPQEAIERGLLQGHEYFVKNIDGDNILISDAVVKEDITVSAEEFKEWFGILEFAEL